METTALEPRGRALDGDEVDGRAAGGSILDRTIDLSAVGWVTIGWVVVVAVAVAVRLARLDVWAMTPEEARRAYDAYSLYLGRSLDPGDELPTTAPLFLLLQAFGFFLFGVTDATARIMPALVGVAMVPLAWLLRPFVGKTTALGMGALLALSPTLIYGSRLGTPAIVVAATTLGLVVAVLRIGLPGASDGAVRRRSAVAGVALGLLFASGPVSLTVMVALAIGVGVVVLAGRSAGRDDALTRSGAAIARVSGTLASAVAGVLATLLVVFTRLFSDIGAIAGLGETVADWGRLVGTTPNTVPTQFFLLGLLLYETLAVVFAIVAVAMPNEPTASAGEGADQGLAGRLGWTFFAGWFVGILFLLSLTSGRMAEHLIQISLPLVLLGGLGLGELAARLDWRNVFRGSGGLLALCYLGVLVGLAAFGILAARIDEASSRGAATFQALFVAFLVILPLGYGIFVLIEGERRAGRGGQGGRLALLVVALILAAFTLRSTIGLNFYNADEGTEPLAQRTATEAVRPMVDRLLRLSRDTTLNRASVRDTTGGRSLVIALDEQVEWPFRWYFREFRDLDVVPSGTAAGTGAEVVFAPEDAGLAEAGYTPRTYPYLNRVPAAYSEPDTGGILATMVRPDRWIDGARYLLFRELENPAVAETVVVGLNGELAARVAPSSGPFNLFDRAGAGSGRGQFSLPRGVAVDPETGVTYVVDMGNLRIERFDADGVFIGIWGGAAEGSIKFGSLGQGFGPTGIAVGPGLVYVADTWNHKIVAIDDSGQVVREIGSGELVDLANDPARTAESEGFFFGPRAVTVYNDEIYVVDTGNERIQVFGLDGVFRRVWGGYGSGPDQLMEPVGIAVGPDGLLYVADSDNGRISVFTPEGAPIRQFPVAAWAGGQYVEPYLTWGPGGLLYATSRLTGSVEVFDQTGTQVDSIREVDGLTLQQPVGIATDLDGAILISDAGRSAVVRYVPPAATSVEPADEGTGAGDGSGGGDAGGIVLPGGGTPESAAGGQAGGEGSPGGSNQVEVVAPTNQAPPDAP